MNTIRQDLNAKGTLISDGAWGTFLIASGLTPSDCPELWNIDRPGIVRGIAQDYIDAGAQLITTNSFGGTRFKLESYGLADRATEINTAAAALSREAAGAENHVIASMGPTGKILMMGEVSESELEDAFREQAEALENGGADALCIETMSAIDEAAAAVRAAKAHTNCEIIASFTFDREVNGVYHTMMGVNPEQMANAMLEAGADILGANCSLGPAEMVSVVTSLRAAAPDTPILVHPNAGQPLQQDGGVVYPETPEEFAARVPALLEAGANILGGCCGTTPAHIQAVRDAVAGASA